MNAAPSEGSAHGEDPQETQSGSTDFSAPLAGLKTGRLVLASEIEWMSLSAYPQLPYLYQARIRGPMPGVRVQENTVTLDTGPLSPHPVAQPNQLHLEIRLNGAIPWEIEFRQGVSHLDGDLRQIELLSLDVLGSANYTRLALPPPSGTLFLYISGDTSQSTFLTFPGSEVKLHIGRGATDLAFDHQRYDILEGETNLASPGFNGTRDRYEFCLSGAVNSVAIRSRAD
jgi:hypothetical protein